MQLHRNLIQVFLMAFWGDPQMYPGKAHYKGLKEKKIRNFFLIEGKLSCRATVAVVELAFLWKALKSEFSGLNGLVIASKKDLPYSQKSFACLQSAGWGNT